MIQDIKPKKYDISYLDKTDITPDDYLLVYDKNMVLLVDEDTPRIPKVRELSYNYDGRTVYLFTIDDEHFFLAYDEYEAPPAGMSYHPMREFLDFDPRYLGYAGITGAQLYRWYNSNRFCGKCGDHMEHSKLERAVVCPSCKNTVYPRINPACIIALVHDDKIVVTKYAGNAKAKNYALIAGFVETGETFEDCVRREVMEEVGLKVKDIRYYKSQPWSLTDTLLAGFYCHLDGSDEIHMDEGELSVAKWIDREELDMSYYSPALTYEMLLQFRLGNQN